MNLSFSPAAKFVVLAYLAILSGCNKDLTTQFHSGPEYPNKLSEWGIVSSAAEIAGDSELYALNTALFSDYAHKLRTLHVPSGAHLEYHPNEAFSAPVGTVISKTFFYFTDEAGRVILDAEWDQQLGSLEGRRYQLIETRLLVKQEHGWDALPYLWQGEEAYLAITGDLLSLTTTQDTTLNYLVPSRNQCASCHATDHTTGALQPIGIKARHLHRPHPTKPDNQLLVLPVNNVPDLDTVYAAPRFERPDYPIEARARAYLDINCAHCHNPTGPADTSGLLLNHDNHDLTAMGQCKPPIAAGRGTGGHLYGIVPGKPDESILLYRLKTSDPGTMMPELGRSLVHEAGVSLVASWIDELAGECR